jgi:cytochrome c
VLAGDNHEGDLGLRTSMKTVLAAGLALSFAAAGAAFAQPAGDAAAGATLFKMRCAICHGQQGEGGALAPSLKGIVGSKAASGTFARYTPALKGSGLTWTRANLDSFLAKPAGLVPGTAMVIAVPAPAERANILAHLATLKK